VCIDGLDAVEVDATSTSEPEPELESGPELEAEAHVDEEPEAEEEEEEQGISTGSEALDSILLHSQQSMLRAIEKTGRRVEDAIVAAQQLSGYDEDLAVRGKTPLASPYDLE
jgi:hypothetical protein